MLVAILFIVLYAVLSEDGLDFGFVACLTLGFVAGIYDAIRKNSKNKPKQKKLPPSTVGVHHSLKPQPAKKIYSFYGETGEDYEWYVAERLDQMGYTKVRVTQLSGDYGADIIAYDPHGLKTCVQCKMYSKPVGIDAVQEIYGAMAYYDCVKAMVITTNTYTNAARELANKTGVLLIANFK